LTSAISLLSAAERGLRKMTNSDKILEFLIRNSPNSFSNSDISNKTGVRPHQQVFQITRRLMDSGEINGRLFGKEWVFWVDRAMLAERTGPNDEPVRTQPSQKGAAHDVAREFERLARTKMSGIFNTMLRERELPRVRKRFDFVSEDGAIVGDAKYYSMIAGERFPPAKIATITEHVWLLEKTAARMKFLVFGNDKRVPTVWLERYGDLLSGIDFYFLSEDGELTKLN